MQGLIDHHRIGTLITRGPLDAWIRAVGCSATVLLELMGHDNLSRAQARLLLGAIISDTFNFTSPTTTAEDRLAVERLLPIADLVLAPFAQTLLERRTQLGDTPLCELLVADEKAYQIAGHSLMVSQICVMDPSQIHSRMEELHHAMAQRLTLDSLDGYVLMLTDSGQGEQRAPLCQQGHTASRAGSPGGGPQPQERGASLVDPTAAHKPPARPCHSGGPPTATVVAPLRHQDPCTLARSRVSSMITRHSQDKPHGCATHGPFTHLIPPSRGPWTACLHSPFNCVCYADVNKGDFARPPRQRMKSGAQDRRVRTMQYRAGSLW